MILIAKDAVNQYNLIVLNQVFVFKVQLQLFVISIVPPLELFPMYQEKTTGHGTNLWRYLTLRQAISCSMLQKPIQ
jgi:hypothetical protein